MSVTTGPPPLLEDVSLETRDGVVNFTARRLGYDSSQRPGKERWFEVAIYLTPDSEYLVHTQGRSTRPGETTRSRLARTRSAFEVVELLTVHHNDKIYLPRQSSRALAQAAQWDDDIRDAYVNRAVL